MPCGVWFLRVAGQGQTIYSTGPDLKAISDWLRYIFSVIPCMPQARSLMALVQVNKDWRNYLRTMACNIRHKTR